MRPRARRSALIALMLFAVLIGTTQIAAAHPLGNFTISHYSELTFEEERIVLRYALDLAEIPTFQERARLDPDGDGVISIEESNSYVDATLPELVKGLDLTVAGERIDLTVDNASVRYRDGEGGLKTTLIEATLIGALPADWRDSGTGTYVDSNYDSRLGWREIVVRGGDGVTVPSTDALTTSISNGLTDYPDDQLSSPLDMRGVSFELTAGSSPVPDADRAANVAESTRKGAPSGSAATDRLAERLAEADLTPGLIAVLLLLAAGWGAVHALSPGHGKAVVAAYLVGTRGTARHASILGLTVTLTHTAGVFLLAIVTLSLSRFILPEDLYPWLGVGSGVLVVAIGATLLYGRVRAMLTGESGSLVHDHSDPDHGHSHAPPGRVTTRSLLAMGVSGGLVPCPSALILLLSAISLDRLELGIVLVIAFSLGLAAVLVAIGLLVVYARWIFRRFSFELRVPRLLPAASAAAISIAGFLIVYQSLYQTGLV